MLSRFLFHDANCRADLIQRLSMDVLCHHLNILPAMKIPSWLRESQSRHPNPIPGMVSASTTEKTSLACSFVGVNKLVGGKLIHLALCTHAM